MRHTFLLAAATAAVTLCCTAAPASAQGICEPTTDICVTGLDERVQELEYAVADAQDTVDDLRRDTEDQVYAAVQQALAPYGPLITSVTDTALRVAGDAFVITVAAANEAVEIASSESICTPRQAGTPICVTGAGKYVQAVDAYLCASDPYWAALRGCGPA